MAIFPSPFLGASTFMFGFSYITFVRTRFVTTQSDIGFAREKTHTISFIERGFERLGLGHQTVVSRGVHT